MNLGIKSVPVKQGSDDLHRYWGLCFHKGVLEELVKICFNILELASLSKQRKDAQAGGRV